MAIISHNSQGSLEKMTSPPVAGHSSTGDPVGWYEMVLSFGLCGIPILSSVTSPSYDWLQEYRAIYRNLTGAFVTGVGRYDGSSIWLVPVDSSLRWDSSPRSTIAEASGDARPRIRWPACFILHDVCWHSLKLANLWVFRFYGWC